MTRRDGRHRPRPDVGEREPARYRAARAASLVRRNESGLTYCSSMNRTVICISHDTGADGTELGRLVADRLGFRLVDEEIITRAAENQKVNVDDLADVERRKSLLNRILREAAVGAATGPAEMYVTAYAAEPQPGKNSLRQLIRQSIKETADEGDVVIVSHAASYALADRDNVLRVLVTASPGTRAGRLVDANGLDEKQAKKSIDANDAGRADYLDGSTVSRRTADPLRPGGQHRPDLRRQMVRNRGERYGA